jgi:hypothetical protein
MALKVEKHDTPAYVAPRAIEVLPPDALTELGDGDYTVTVGAHPDLRDEAGQSAQAGDVLSVQPDGTLQTRRAGATGAYERCRPSPQGLIFRPQGVEGRTFLVASTSSATPNV